MARALWSPRMMSQMVARYPSRCTIQQRTDTADAGGQPIPAWTTLANHRDIPCSVAALEGMVHGHETRLIQQELDVEGRHVALNGYFPDITISMRCAIDGVAYNIIGTDSDSHKQTTRLRVQDIT